MTTIVVLLSSLTYLTYALAEMSDLPYGVMPGYGGWHILHYGDWLCVSKLCARASAQDLSVLLSGLPALHLRAPPHCPPSFQAT